MDNQSEHGTLVGSDAHASVVDFQPLFWDTLRHFRPLFSSYITDTSILTYTGRGFKSHHPDHSNSNKINALCFGMGRFSLRRDRTDASRTDDARALALTRQSAAGRCLIISPRQSNRPQMTEMTRDTEMTAPDKETGSRQPRAHHKQSKAAQTGWVCNIGIFKTPTSTSMSSSGLLFPGRSSPMKPKFNTPRDSKASAFSPEASPTTSITS